MPDERVHVPWVTDLSLALAATVCAVVLWFFSAVLGGVDLDIGSGSTTQHVSGVAVALTAAVVSLVGLLLLRFLESRLDDGLRIWTLLAAAVAVGSLLGPLGATSAAAKGTLIALHTVVAVVVIVGARRARPADGAG